MRFNIYSKVAYRICFRGVLTIPLQSWVSKGCDNPLTGHSFAKMPA
jgi:hypothetical protein